MATWVVNVDFQGGAGWEDISGGVMLTSFVRRRQIWNKLSPTVNTLDFALKTEASALIAKFMTASDDILIAVTKDSVPYFTGMIQPNYSVTVGGRIRPFDISCVDNGYRIQRRILANINWTNYKVCDPANTASSILHQLMVAAGLTASAVYSSVVTIDKTIDRFVGVAGQDEVWTMVKEVLFDFGYTFYFRPDGTLDVQDFAPSSISTTDVFSSDAGDTKNIIGSLKVERNDHDYEAVRVTWSTHKTLTNALLFSDTTNGNAVRKCYIQVESAAYWPVDSDQRDIYAEYAIEGYELVATSAIVLSMDRDAEIVQDTFTDEITRAKIKYHNSGGTPAWINRFDIYGTAIVKDQTNINTRVVVADTNKYLDIESKYLYAKADADKLCDAVAQYYYNADMVYTLTSRSEFDPGSYVYVKETGFLAINNLCVVREVSDIEYSGEHNYVLEGVAAYSAGSPTGTGSANIPLPVSRPASYTIGTQGFAGFADAYLDGTADETEINTAIVLQNALGGGTVNIVGGSTVVIASAITMLSNVTLNIEPGVVIEKNCNDYAIECVGTSGTHATNVKICGTGTVTRASADTNAKPLIYFEYADDSAIEGVAVDGSYNDGIYLVNCDTVNIGGGVKITGCAGTGLKTVQSIVIIAIGVAIAGCAIGCEMCPSNATDIADRGDCESETAPMVTGETVPVLWYCTWARSGTQKYAGSYSYLMTPSDPTATALLTDNFTATDMHGFVAGSTYLVVCKAYMTDADCIPNLTARISTNSSTFSTTFIAYSRDVTTSAWGDIALLFKIPATATGIYVYAQIGQQSEPYHEGYFDDFKIYQFEETDSGCQLVNSSIDSCTDTGVSIVNNQAIIQNNQVTGCTNQGIEVLAGYRNIVTGNRAYNNGSDTGIENDNQDNFYDAGIDTQNVENSWNYLPVSGEPSWGSPHTHVETLVDAADPAGTGDTAVTCTNVPTGTKGIFGYATVGSGTAGRSLTIKDAAANEWTKIRNPTTAILGHGEFIVPLDSSKQFLYAVNNADVNNVSIYLRGYYI